MPNVKLFWKKNKSVTLNSCDPMYKVVYLGNVVTEWAKGEACVDKPLASLWRSYCQSGRQDIGMKVTICDAGLKAVTKQHGLTEYWASRISYCCCHPSYPRVFCWIYRHEGRKMKQELRCHAVLCSKKVKSEEMCGLLKARLASALQEFRREKHALHNARICYALSVLGTRHLPNRQPLLYNGIYNFRPPIEKAKNSPKLESIEESLEEEEEPDKDKNLPQDLFPLLEIGVESCPSVISEISSDIAVDFDCGLDAKNVGCFESEECICQCKVEFGADTDSLLYCPCGHISSKDTSKEQSLIEEVQLCYSSVTSDQPESMSSHASESGPENTTLVIVKENECNLSKEECDNISEESGYSEEKEPFCASDNVVIIVTQ